MEDTTSATAGRSKTRLTAIIAGIVAAVLALGAASGFAAARLGGHPAALRPVAHSAPARTAPPTVHKHHHHHRDRTRTIYATPPPQPQAQAPAQPAPQEAPLTSGPAVILQFYQDLTNQDYQAAWALGGDNLNGGVGYDQWVAGYATTASITVDAYGTYNDGTVWTHLSAVQTDGSVKTYDGTYTVTGGVITSADMTQTG